MQHMFNSNSQIDTLFSDEMGFARHFFLPRPPGGEYHLISRDRGTIKSREKHYSLVLYILKPYILRFNCDWRGQPRFGSFPGFGQHPTVPGRHNFKCILAVFVVCLQSLWNGVLRILFWCVFQTGQNAWNKGRVRQAVYPLMQPFGFVEYLEP